MKTTLRALLWVLLLLVLAVICWGIVLYLDWPIWGAFALFFAVIAGYYAIKFWRRVWVVARSRVKLAQSELASRRLMTSEKQSIQTLSEKWASGIRLLRKSTLRRFGNPIKVLPWCLVVGETNSGKSSLIASSGLGSFIQNIDLTQPIEPTRYCEWWFFNKAIVIDTAGRFVSANGSESDIREWDKLLDLLVRSRPRDGVNGLVITVSAEHLIAGNTDALEAEGRNLRNRIEQLIRLFDKRFPVYLVVTKADQICGFDQLADALGENEFHQALGYLSPGLDGDNSEVDFLGMALGSITERIKQLRLTMAMQGKALGAESLLFSSEMNALKPAMLVFMKACFGNSPYLEQPLLRALYFTSSYQPGGAFSKILDGIPAAPKANQEKNSLFLHDLFSRVIPKDREYYWPTQLVNRWRVLTQNFASISWVAFFLAACIFVLMSYVKTKAVIEEIEIAFPNEQVLNSQNRDDQAIVVLKMKEVVDLILKNEEGWSTSWLAFSPKIKGVENQIKESYVNRVMAFITSGSPFYDRYEPVLAKPNTIQYGQAVHVLSHLVNLYQARVNGANYQQLQELPDIPLKGALANDFVMARVFGENYDHMFKAFLAWQPSNTEFLRYALNANRSALTHFVFDQPQMDFLLTWVDSEPGISSVMLKDFWLPNSNDSSGVQIRGAFTRAGEEKIQHLLDSVGKALNDSAEYRIKRATFERWYRAERINAWKTFAWEFSKGQDLLGTEPSWRDVVIRLDTINSPYIQFLDRLRDEFELVRKEELPEWLAFARDVDQLGYEARSGGVLRKASSVFAAINRVGGKSLRNSVNTGSNLLPGDITKSLAAIDALRSYRADFDLVVADAISGEGKSLQIASDFYAIGINPEVKSSLLQNAYLSFQNFRKNAGYDTADDQVIWQLVRGPLDMLVRYIQQQASCALQQDWEKSVVLRSQMTTSEKELSNQLYGKDGTVWTFVDGPAKPFVQQKSDGFGSAKVQGFAFPFTSEFIPYLNRSMTNRVEQLVREQRADVQKGKTVKLKISPRPVGVNAAAKAKPYAAIFTLQCAAEDIIVNNFNTSTTETIAWSPETCGDVSLQIKVENLTLSRRYPGPLGFARFLNDFRDGEGRFTPLDFPSVKSKLDALNIKVITVPYDISGVDAALQLADDMNYLQELTLPATLRPLQAKRRVPVIERIGQCWVDKPTEGEPLPLSVLMDKRAQMLLDERLNPVSKAEVAKAPSHKTASSKHNKPIPQVNKSSAPKATADEARVAPTQTIYYVQVGAYSNPTDVTAARTQLRNLRLSVTEEPMGGANASGIRVLAGPFMERESANQALNRLNMLGITGLVVKR